ncbi:alpha/beta fold hydrolase [Kitasatospora sp. NPDC057692]|uniref:alpha/beta fold hydrolase n=1 Tax=Kitasatospora sp. NPDC057692 TaxID=3346215 RepID=UPI003691BE3E
MPFAAGPGARVSYAVEGSGRPPLVFVHGTGFGAAGTFGHLVGGFTDVRTVLLPDFAGCGDTEDDGRELTPELLAEQIAAVIEAAGDDPADVVGFSLGSVVAAALAALRPELVRSLVLTAGWSRPDDAYLRNHMTVWRAVHGNAELFGRFGTLTAFSRDHLNALDRDVLEASIRGNGPTEGALRHIDLNLRADIRPLLPRITARTLVIGCTQDATVPVGLSRELADAIAGSTYAEIDSGHVVVHEQGAAWSRLVRDFVLQEGRSRTSTPLLAPGDDARSRQA